LNLIKVLIIRQCNVMVITSLKTAFCIAAIEQSNAALDHETVAETYRNTQCNSKKLDAAQHYLKYLSV